MRGVNVSRCDRIRKSGLLTFLQNYYQFFSSRPSVTVSWVSLVLCLSKLSVDLSS